MQSFFPNSNTICFTDAAIVPNVHGDAVEMICREVMEVI